MKRTLTIVFVIMLMLSTGIGVFVGKAYTSENKTEATLPQEPINKEETPKKKATPKIVEAEILPDTATGNIPVYQGHAFGCSLFDGMTIALKKTGKMWTPVEPKGSYQYTYFGKGVGPPNSLF